MRRSQSAWTLARVACLAALFACEPARAPAPEPASPAVEPPHQAPGHPTAGRRRNRANRPPFEVFAAASLREVMTELGAAFEAQGRPRVVLNFAGSNVLAQQLVASPRGEVFVSADDQWVRFLRERGHVEPDTEIVVAGNTLAFVAHPSASYALADVAALPSLGFTHLSLADPEAVPAGRYAKAYLASVPARGGSVWDAVRARVAPAADVRAALALVATQSDVVGVVYRTDARAAAVRVLHEVPVERLPSPVRYTAVAIAGRERIPLCRAFLDFLRSTEGQAVFLRHGFLPAPAPSVAPAPPVPAP